MTNTGVHATGIDNAATGSCNTKMQDRVITVLLIIADVDNVL